MQGCISMTLCGPMISIARILYFQQLANILPGIFMVRSFFGLNQTHVSRDLALSGCVRWVAWVVLRFANTNKTMGNQGWRSEFLGGRGGEGIKSGSGGNDPCLGGILGSDLITSPSDMRKDLPGRNPTAVRWWVGDSSAGNTEFREACGK